ncbi:TIGR00730 family Rossman fold protein [Verticiella sediminum]|uniref:Cytokinin riboside 5'-monophosphate phosphoribohydrolase n=1 Tax=Verticiella sediminum TaxID=1247510 RepID=A0A556AQB8_9BURK|nr:TIGR00730 family Rossman fold protein [Verticiella sediminum]TSH95080.1 TIGR00730 family Rossman fold protein [Verticiella sediminum]
MSIRSLCIYCGSNPGNRPEYVAAAAAFGTLLAERGIRLVYGGASIGVMGRVADAALAAGGEVYGVIPQALVDREVAHSGLSELFITASMHERKARMAELSDAFVALPGGIGTLEEIFEIWTWAQLGMHAKPCGLLNVAGYYDTLVRFLDETVHAGFVREGHRGMLLAAVDGPSLLEAFRCYEAPAVHKWVEKSET